LSNNYFFCFAVQDLAESYDENVHRQSSSNVIDCMLNLNANFLFQILKFNSCSGHKIWLLCRFKPQQLWKSPECKRSVIIDLKHPFWFHFILQIFCWKFIWFGAHNILRGIEESSKVLNTRPWAAIKIQKIMITKKGIFNK